jgi:replicative DNA helicase
MIAAVPQNRTAERAALSILSFSPECLLELPWSAELFHDPACQLIFGAIETAASEGHGTDLIGLTSAMEAAGTLQTVGDAARLTEIIFTFGGPNPGLAGEYFAKLSAALTARNTLAAARGGLADLEQMTVRPAEYADRVTAAAQGPEIVKRATLAEHLDSLCAELERSEAQECFSLGLPGLDSHLAGGLHRGELGVIAADTSRGKSILLSMAALSALKQAKAVALFSLEMPGKDILRRMAANLAGLPVLGAHERPGKYHLDAASRAITTLYGMPLTIVDDLSSLADLDREARRLARLRKADVIIVDYLQLVENPDADSREQAVSEVARKLKNLALNCGAVVFTASQMNEAGQLRESRAIGHHADAIINIGDNRITVEKNRRGSRGVGINVTLRGELGRFEEAATAAPPEHKSQGRYVGRWPDV